MKSSVLFTVGANCVRPWETAGLPYEQKTIRKKQYEQKMIRKKQIEIPDRFFVKSSVLLP